MDDCFNSFGIQSIDLNNDIQREDRCRVIKLLQEQVQSLLFYKSEYDQMKKRAEMAERLLEMRESEIKLKFDELEETFKILEDENQRLKAQLSKEFKKSMPDISINESSSQNTEENENKWKLKYKALARMTNGTITVNQTTQDNSALQSQIDELKRMNDEKSKNIITLSEELQKASKESSQAKESAAKLLKQVQKLQNELETYKDENSKLRVNQRQKSALLQHTRNQQEKNIKSQKQIEINANNEIEEQKKKFLTLNSEITRLTNAYDKEQKVRRNAERKIIKLTKSNEEIKQKLQESLQKFQDENKLLQDEINGNKVAQANLQNELKQVQTANDELQAALIKSEKIKKRKEKLELTVKEMKETIDELQTSISSVESDSSARFEELKNLLIKYWGGSALNYDWHDCLSCIDEKFSILQANEAMIQMLKTKMTKMKKKNQKLHNDIIVQNSESQSVSASQQSEAFSSDLRAEPQIIYKETPNPYKDINMFRHSISRRINKIYFKLYDDVNKLNCALQESVNDQSNSSNSRDDVNDPNDFNGSNNKSVSMRSLILFSIIAQKWKTFKNNQPFDKTCILEYLPAQLRKETNLIPTFIQKMKQTSIQLRQQMTQNSILAKANQELTIRVQQAESELLRIQEIDRKRSQETSEIQQRIKFYESKCQKLIDPQAHENVKQQLQKQIMESKNLEKQLMLLKSEMKNLLTSIDGKHEEISDMQTNMMNLADENEELRHHLDDLSHELSVTQAALKERTKELLAIERKLMKEKKSVVIVKESIPISQSNYKIHVKDEHQSNCGFLTEAIRGGLAKMQTKIMKGDGMI